MHQGGLYAALQSLCMSTEDTAEALDLRQDFRPAGQ